MATDFVDTHLHIWNPNRVQYGWLEEAPAILNQIHEPSAIADEAKASGMRQAILVQAANDIAETEYLLAQAEKHNWIAGVVGWVDLLNPAVADRQLRTLTKNPYLKGIRHLIHGETNGKWLIQAPVLESLAILADYNLTYDVVGTTLVHLDCAIRVAQQLPALQLVLDHLSQPPVNFAQAVHWKSRMQTAASCPNIAAKISGLGTATQRGMDWDLVDIHPWIVFALETIGTDRLTLGSDWPVCLLAGSYQHTVDSYKAVIRSLVYPSEVEAMFITNARRLYRL